MMGIEGWERRPRPQRLPPGLLLPSAPGVWRCRPAWAAGSWKEGALSGAGEVGWGALPPSFLWRGVLWRWRRNLNRPRGNVSGEEERPGPGSPCFSSTSFVTSSSVEILPCPSVDLAPSKTEILKLSSSRDPDCHPGSRTWTGPICTNGPGSCTIRTALKIALN